MSLFNIIKIVSSKIIVSEFPGQKSSIPKEVRQHTRKSTENTVDKVNTTLGNVVRKFHNTQDSIENVVDSLDLVKITTDQLFKKIKKDEIDIGDHIYTQAIGYTHHGLYIGNDEVIHYAHDDGKNYISVRIDSLKKFADNRAILKKSNYESPANYEPSEIRSRAYSRLGEKSYNLLANNCENFVRWCRHGGKKYDNW